MLKKSLWDDRTILVKAQVDLLIQEKALQTNTKYTK